MIPIDLTQAKLAFNAKKINMWELGFLDKISKLTTITEKEYNKFEEIGNKMLPFAIVDMSLVADDYEPIFAEIDDKPFKRQVMTPWGMMDADLYEPYQTQQEKYYPEPYYKGKA